MTTDTLPYIPSNMDDEECFRLHGTLPPERIASMLDAESDMVAACVEVIQRVDDVHDGLPCEDFAEDITYRLAQLRDDEGTTSAMADEVQSILDAVESMQRDLYVRAETAAKHLRAIEDSLSAWIES
jgi:hypothetical protein